MEAQLVDSLHECGPVANRADHIATVDEVIGIVDPFSFCIVDDEFQIWGDPFEAVESANRPSRYRTIWVCTTSPLGKSQLGLCVPCGLDRTQVGSNHLRRFVNRAEGSVAV